MDRVSQVTIMVKNPPANAGDVRDTGSIPGSGRSPREGNGNPLQCSCLENPMDRRAWRAAVHGVTKSWIRLRGFGTKVDKLLGEVPHYRQWWYSNYHVTFEVFLKWRNQNTFIFFLIALCGVWHLSSATRGQTGTPCIVRQRLHHWTTREVPPLSSFTVRKQHCERRIMDRWAVKEAKYDT